ncbi:putative signaling protein (plasmid) [Peptoclostridium acidaminophilum DSM 3953]|uniref:Putative signaling protein n=1 Tax=Peptoclostridium acidaminophilum DSM 3953 TaxID=1286171 RepID=W8U9L6_PEPAC|nr:EAL domain-containing protein [Peptoclostridium acidaminophilum]AHM57551.1 putative signaling protein [Peptoclostridium acidaminophilum DSM 3953]
MRFIASFLIILTLLTSNICSAQTLRVGTYEDKPLVFKGEKGKPQGFAIDVLEEIARQQGFDVTYSHSNFSESISRIKSGEIDILVDVIQTPERDNFMNFTKESLMENWGIVITKPLDDINTIFALSEKRVAVLEDDIYGENFMEQLDMFKVSAHIVKADSYEQVISMIENGSADAGVLNKLAISQHKADRPVSFKETPVIFSPVQMKYGFSKNVDSEFIERFDSALLGMKKYPFSEFYEASSRWFPTQESKQLPYWSKISLYSLLGATLLSCVMALIFKRKSSRARRELESTYSEVVELNRKLQKDCSKIKQKNELIKKLAYYDQITGLKNKQSLDYDLGKLCTAGEEFAVAFFSIDNLKGISSALGHRGRDMLAKKVSERLSLAAHRYDSIYRWEGTEFVLIVKGPASCRKGELLAKETMSLFKSSMQIKGSPVFVSGSMGISRFPEDSKNPGELIKKAAMALEHVQLSGRNGYRFYDEKLSNKTARDFLMETKLREALLSDELQVYYQPRVDSSSGSIVGLEALVRWFDCDGKSIRPDEFIPIAEDSGLITGVGEVVLHKACAHAKQLCDAGYPLPVSVNLSPKQFEDSGLLNILDDALFNSGLDHSLLELEITENAVLGNLAESIKTLELIRSRGIKLLLDDFGTGYSSLNYLMSLPLDFLKIDKIFMDKLFQDTKHENIVEFIIVLAKSLGLKIIAEGIEEPEQLDYLKRKCCDEYQGYLFSKPLPFESLLELVGDNFS